MSEATLKTKLTGDSAELKKSFKEGIEAAREFGTEVGAHIKETLLEITGLVIGVESIREAFDKTLEGIEGVFELSKDLRNLSNQTGASIKDLVQLRAEFDLSGIASDNVGNTLNKMQRSIEEAADKGGKMAEIFGRLNLNVRNLQGLDPASQFEEIRKSISSIEDPARRAQVAMELFGRGGSGGSVLAIFGNSKIAEEASSVISAQANILSRNSETFQEASIALETAGINLKGFFVGMAEPISQILLPVLAELNSIDLIKWGGEIGTGIANAIRVLYNAFQEGKLSELVSLAMEVGFQKAGNALAGGLKAVALAFGDTILEFFSTKFADGVGNIFIGIAEQFGGALIKAINGPLATLQATISYQFDKADAAKNTQSSYADALANGLISNENRTKADAAFVSGDSAGFDRFSKIAEEASRRQEISQAAGDNYAALQKMGLSDYLKFNSNKQASFFGINGEDWSEKGKATASAGRDELAPILGDALAKAFGDIGSSKSINVFGDSSSKLSDLFNKLNKAVPGEGKENEAEKTYGAGQAGRDFGFGDLKGISRDASGQWSYFSSTGQNAVSFGGGGGVADRAGRMESSPDGKSPSDYFADMVKYLKDIDSSVQGVTAPA